MRDCKGRFLYELSIHLGRHPDREEILCEFEDHLAHIEIEAEDEARGMELLLERLGPPKQIAKEFMNASGETSSAAKWVFIGLNHFFFLIGFCLTIGAHFLEIPTFQEIWSSLADQRWLLLYGYFGLWVWFGYSVGKEWGHGGKGLLHNTLLLSLIPNLMLMLAVLFRILPSQWFAMILTPSFLVGCMVATGLFLPVGSLSYKWGVRRAV